MERNPQHAFQADDLQCLACKSSVMKSILRGSPIPTFIIDCNHVIVHWNLALEKLTGIAEKDVIGTSNQWNGFYAKKRPVLADLVLDGNIDTAKALYKEGGLRESGVVPDAYEAEGEFTLNGNQKWLYFTAAIIRDRNGNALGAIETLQDVTSQKESEQQAKRQAHFDPLTGLPNRVEFAERLRKAISWTDRNGSPLIVGYIDLDGFKPINDTYGHHAGDEVLKEISRRATKELRVYDTIARIGGDEFALLLSDINDEREADIILSRLRSSIAETMSIYGIAMNVSASIGFCVYNKGDKTDPDILLRQSDIAMYAAKRAGRNKIVEFNPRMIDAFGGWFPNVSPS